MSKFKAGDKVKVVKYTNDNWYDERWLGKEYTVSKCYSEYVSLVEFNDETYGFELGHIELVKADSIIIIEGKVTTTEDAILQLASLLGDAFSDITISIQYDSVTVDWNNMGFVATDAKELEDICKAITLLSGAKIGN